MNQFWKKPWVIVLAIVVLLGVWLGGAYNSFVTNEAAINTQWSQVQTVYQRRFDLIPNVVATVSGVAKQEQAVFGQIAEARTKYAGAITPSEQAAAASQLETGLGRLLVIAENYPTLQSSQAYRDLIVTLEGTENRVSVERQKFNTLVGDWNAKVSRFPSNLVANMFGFKTKNFFEAATGADQAPKVDFSK